MSKYTPGPWRVVEDRVPGALEIYARKKAIAECWRRADVTEELANACLLAAAPNLLEALEELLYARTDKAEKMAQDAIEKARGMV